MVTENTDGNNENDKFHRKQSNLTWALANDHEIYDTSRTTEYEQASFDSLPYIDYIDENYEAYALSLIEEEMKTMEAEGKNKNYLVHMRNPLVQKYPNFYDKGHHVSQREYQGLCRRKGAASSLPSRIFSVESIAPPSSLSNEEHAWRHSLRNAKIELEYRRLQSLELDLRQVFEADEWLAYVNRLQSRTVAYADFQQKIQEKVDLINARRKDMQEREIAPQLQELTERYERSLVNVQNFTVATYQLRSKIESKQENVDVKN